MQQLQQGLMQLQQQVQQAAAITAAAAAGQRRRHNLSKHSRRKADAAGPGRMQKLEQKPTIDQVLDFLKDNRAKAFVLDIETD